VCSSFLKIVLECREGRIKGNLNILTGARFLYQATVVLVLTSTSRSIVLYKLSFGIYTLLCLYESSMPTYAEDYLFSKSYPDSSSSLYLPVSTPNTICLPDSLDLVPLLIDFVLLKFRNGFSIWEGYMNDL